MSTSPSWAQHATPEGDALRRIASVRAWVAVFRVYMIILHSAGVALRDAVVAGVDHARQRIPANLGAPAPERARERVHARA